MVRLRILRAGGSLGGRLVGIAIAFILPAAMVGCDSVNRTVGEATGGAIGGAGGAYVGREVGGEEGAVIGAALGAALGSLIGGEIGRRLDEQDRELATEATAQALEGPVGTTRTWESKTNTGVRGQSEVVGVSQDPSGAQCKTVNQLAVIGGEEIRQSEQWCIGSDGRYNLTT